MRRFLVAIAAITVHAAFLPAPGVTSPPPAGAAVVRVVEVLDGETLRIEPPVDGLSRVRLAGIAAVKPPLARPSERPWPLAERARQTLAELAGDEPVSLVFAARRSDRYRRLLAQVYLADGRWLQGELLRAGLARVSTTPDSRSEARAMLAAEAEARAAGRGLWISPVYAVLAPEQVRDHVGSFAIVEGPVLQTRRVKDRIYLNFGPDWRADFTVTVDAAGLPLFVAAGLDPMTLSGRRIRVRGWVERINGPAIEATHPEQIEVLSPAPP